MVACCVLSMAELAARYATAGGQYHWTWLLAPEKVKRGMVSVLFALVLECVR